MSVFLFIYLSPFSSCELLYFPLLIIPLNSIITARKPAIDWSCDFFGYWVIKKEEQLFLVWLGVRDFYTNARGKFSFSSFPYITMCIGNLYFAINSVRSFKRDLANSQGVQSELFGTEGRSKACLQTSSPSELAALKRLCQITS